MQIFIAKSGSQAAVAVAFAGFLNDLTGKALNTPYSSFSIRGHQFDFGYLQCIAISLIALFTSINCATVIVSGRIAAVLTGVKIALVLGIGLGAFILACGEWGHFILGNVGGFCV